MISMDLRRRRNDDSGMAGREAQNAKTLIRDSVALSNQYWQMYTCSSLLTVIGATFDCDRGHSNESRLFC